MRAVVVYESFFGNGRTIAEAVARELAAQAEVEAIPVDLAPATIDADVGLLVVGGPNHASGLSTAQSRLEAQALATDPRAMPRIGLRTWLSEVAPARQGTRAAIYDTRLVRPRILPLMDHASASIAHRLRRAGFDVVADVRHFSVRDTTGPLVEGELDHARAWARDLAQLLEPARRG